MLQQGMKVMLADLQSSVDLNGQEGVVGTYNTTGSAGSSN
jgi:hypothetical protein